MNTPQRSCIVCKKSTDKRLLVRIVKNKEGEIFLDFTGKKNGRGAYVCNELTCFEKLKKVRAIDRSFKLNIKEDVYDKILNDFKLFRG